MRQIEVELGWSRTVAIFLPDGIPLPTPIVALHGNWATWKRYAKYGPWFADRGYAFIAPTYRYHYSGNGDCAPLGKVSIHQYADEVTGILARLRMGTLSDHLAPMAAPPILIGHSMGGTIAQLIASQRRMSAIILMNSAPVAGIPLHADLAYRIKIMRYTWQILTGKPYLPAQEIMSEYVYNGMPPEMHAEIYDGASHESGTATREILAGSGPWPIRWITRLLSEPIAIGDYDIIGPMLIIGCGKDLITPPVVAQDLCAKYCDRAEPTRLHIFDQFAHWPQYEPGWEASAQYLLDWFQPYLK